VTVGGGGNCLGGLDVHALPGEERASKDFIL